MVVASPVTLSRGGARRSTSAAAARIASASSFSRLFAASSAPRARRRRRARCAARRGGRRRRRSPARRSPSAPPPRLRSCASPRTPPPARLLLRADVRLGVQRERREHVHLHVRLRRGQRRVGQGAVQPARVRSRCGLAPRPPARGALDRISRVSVRPQQSFPVVSSRSRRRQSAAIALGVLCRAGARVGVGDSSYRAAPRN